MEAKVIEYWPHTEVPDDESEAIVLGVVANRSVDDNAYEGADDDLDDLIDMEDFDSDWLDNGFDDIV